jgi:DNA primase
LRSWSRRGFDRADGDREPYDRFAAASPTRSGPARAGDRLQRPILGAGEPKYLNSPDTPCSTRAKLFNIDLAAPAARVEAGDRGRRADGRDRPRPGRTARGRGPLGTALTETQLALLWKLSPPPSSASTATRPGQKAALSRSLRALPSRRPGPLARLRHPPGRSRTTDTARRRRAASKLCWRSPNRGSSGCGATKALRAPSSPRTARRPQARLLDTSRQSATPTCADQYARADGALQRPHAEAQALGSGKQWKQGKRPTPRGAVSAHQPTSRALPKRRNRRTGAENELARV